MPYRNMWSKPINLVLQMKKHGLVKYKQLTRIYWSCQLAEAGLPDLLATQKSVPEKETNVGQKEGCFSSECWQSGERVDSLSTQNHLLRFSLTVKVFKGKKESQLCQSLMYRAASPSPTAHRLLNSLLRCNLVHSLFVRLLKGKLGKWSVIC